MAPYTNTELYTNIRNVNCVAAAQYLTMIDAHKKWAKHNSGITFLTRCKKNNIYPRHIDTYFNSRVITEMASMSNYINMYRHINNYKHI